MVRSTHPKHTSWEPFRLLARANMWRARLRQRRGKVSARSTQWWWFIHASKTQLATWVQQFVTGQHAFSPMLTCHMPRETFTMWNYLDRLMVYLLFLILRPTFKHIIPTTCISTQGPNSIKAATNTITAALQSADYHYVLRVDIQSYYASIDRAILFNQLYPHYDDPIARHYLNAIVFHAIDNRGNVHVPNKGIPLRSSLSPFFGSLYLAPLDLAFQSMDVFYRRYVDDVIILVKSENQYRKAKKRLFSVLKSLKLKVSPTKTKMGRLTSFHYLGVEFGVSQNPQNDENHVSASMHKRCCARALGRVVALRQHAANAATIQRYLTRWASWWKSVGNWEEMSLLAQWTAYAQQHVPDCAWFGSGLIAFEERLRPAPHQVLVS